MSNQCDEADADSGQSPVLTQALPDQPGSSDLEQGRNGEQGKGSRDGHGAGTFRRTDG
jgi:hypothetical protein